MGDNDSESLMKKTVRTVAVMLAAWALLVGALSAAAVLVTSRAVSPSQDVAESSAPVGAPPAVPASAPSARGHRS